MYAKSIRREPRSTDRLFLWLLVAFSAYLAVFRPEILWIGCFAGAIAASLKLAQVGLTKAFPRLKCKLRSWHVISVVLALTTVFGALDLPAAAQFFNALEEALTSVVAESDSGIDEGIIATIFVFFRILIVLGFIIGVVAVFAQAMRGADWQPIAQLLGVGVAFVIGVEVITQLILEGVEGGGA